MSLKIVTGALVALSLASAPALACTGPNPVFTDDFATQEPSWQAVYGEFSVANGRGQVKSNASEVVLVVNTGDYFDSGDMCVDIIAPDYRGGGNQLGGITFGLKDDGNYFAFVISPPDGAAAVLARKKGEWVVPVPARRADAIKQQSGAVNNLRIVWKGNRATAYINDKQFAVFSAPAQKNSYFGMFAQTEGNTWQYDNFKVSE
jgi:hypothetical protein